MMELWADTMVVFHCPPSEIDRIEVEELVRWHELAIERVKNKAHLGI